ncbi:DUF2251 domain-containing protein [Ectobacillus ponti]|uniref:DUF2251 domain-containing protein n=1 Tax=Ectobacillus ponti TaxID=2961894 RepID=A0AA42BSS7_9BACI|nr:DUF2251 domain-containing protein [Ectobacillus ponti]MCP8970854.1 DUF2251 domain-containing protein [Ectobacillus ponti]
MSHVIENIAPSEEFAAFFEDNGETAYLYLARIANGEILGITDSLWMYNQIEPPISAYEQVLLAWTEDSSRVAFIINGHCLGMMDLAAGRKATANLHGEIPFTYWESGMPQEFGMPLSLEVPKE